MKISQLVTCLDLEVLTMPEQDVQITGGYVGDLLSWVMGRAEAGHVWVTIMTNINILAVASLVGVSAIVVAEGAEISADVIAKAEEQKINLLRTSEQAFDTVVAVGREIGL